MACSPLARHTSAFFGLCVAAVLIPQMASAQVLYEELFPEAGNPGKFVLSGSTNPLVTVDGSGPGGNIALHTFDNATNTSQGNATLPFSVLPAFSTANPQQRVLEISADFAGTDLTLVSGSAAAPRFRLNAGGNTTLTFGIGQLEGNLVLYSAFGASPVPSASNTLLSLGSYVAGSASTNGYISLKISYVDQASSIFVSATQGSVTINRTLQGFVPFTFSNGTNGGALEFTTGSSSTGNQYLDNVVIQVVPEPSTTLLLMGGLAGLGGLRRRSRLHG